MRRYLALAPARRLDAEPSRALLRRLDRRPRRRQQLRSDRLAHALRLRLRLGLGLGGPAQQEGGVQRLHAPHRRLARRHRAAAPL